MTAWGVQARAAAAVLPVGLMVREAWSEQPGCQLMESAHFHMPTIGTARPSRVAA